MATSLERAAPQTNGATKKPAAVAAARPASKKPAQPGTKQVKRPLGGGTTASSKTPAPVQAKAASIAGENPANGVTSAYAIMASRIANRVAEMAESITFVERPRVREGEFTPEKKRPRKLEMRLEQGAGAGAGAAQVAFSAPFLDNTLQKMLVLQNRMLTTAADLSRAEGLDEKTIREHAAQSAELSRIIALICAEKARQGA